MDTHCLTTAQLRGLASPNSKLAVFNILGGVNVITTYFVQYSVRVEHINRSVMLLEMWNPPFVVAYFLATPSMKQKHKPTEFDNDSCIIMS